MAQRHRAETDGAENAGAASEIDFSLWAYFSARTHYRKTRMIHVDRCVLWSWSIIVQKRLIQYRHAKARSERFRSGAFWSGEALDGLMTQSARTPMGREKNFRRGMTEWRRSHRAGWRADPAGATARIRPQGMMWPTRQRSRASAKKACPCLATTGSTAPFVRVCSDRIGNHETPFIEIAAQPKYQPVVCPPVIAEALAGIGMAFGQLIPAVIFVQTSLSADFRPHSGRLRSLCHEFAHPSLAAS